jgi:serine protease Do
MRVGDWVMAIGNPFGLGGSVTVGILSATRRDINSGPYDEFLQTDAAINRGNSGGPLFNMDGEVIGINTAIISPTGGSIGIGFAVPSNTVALVVEQLRRYGQTRRGWIGVRIQNVGEDIAESLGMKTAAGALIANVTPGGPAAKAGLKVGDIILAYDGQDVTELRGLPRLVAQTEVGRVVEVKVWRETEKKTITLRIRVEKLDEGDPAAGKTLRKSEAPAGDGGFMLGLALAPLSDELRSLFAIGETVDGVVVTAIDADSPTVGTPLRPGNVILEVTSEKVKTPEDFASRIAALRALQRKTALLLVADASGEMNFVPLPIGD